MTSEERAIAAARLAWLKNPVDIRYPGELVELGVRVVDAIEMERVRGQQIREELRNNAR